jgi:hypothetical protein
MSRWIERAARIAYTFVIFNYSALSGLLALSGRREVWR